MEDTISKTTAILKELEWRGLLFQTSDRKALLVELEAGPVTLYQGFDPTAESLHVGNLLGILVLRRFQEAGHRPIALVGGGTGLIGDPSGRSTERQLSAKELVDERAQNIKQQLSQFLDFDRKDMPALLENNYSWLSELMLIDFLRDIGKHFSLKEMIDKESVSARLSTTGISFTEFNYMVLQACDYLELYQRFGCTLQIGGSDQWGNITSGVSLIRKMLGKEVFALTVPLVTTADGKKFGKSEGNAVWLDASKTSLFAFYQFWIRTDDRDVIKFLKFFTFLSRDEIEEFEQKVLREPEKREAQRRLAHEATMIVHGKEAAVKVAEHSRKFFESDIRTLSEEELEEIYRGTTKIVTLDQLGDFVSFVELFCLISKRQAREDIENAAISINDEVWRDKTRKLSKEDFLYGKYLKVRHGKREVIPVILQS